MKMSDVKVGMKLQSTLAVWEEPIIVTEIVSGGFKYAHSPRSMKLGPYEYGICEGGEHYGYNGECLYEEITQINYDI